MKPTHRLVGGSTALVAGVVAELPVAVVLGVSLLAAAASSFPDDVERPLKLPHRQITHYPLLQLLLAGALAAAMLSFSPLGATTVLYLTGALAVAWLMHSVADAMTKDRRGIALLWPIRRRGYHLLPGPLRAEVGRSSPSEYVFGVAWSVFVLCFLYARFRHSIPA